MPLFCTVSLRRRQAGTFTTRSAFRSKLFYRMRGRRKGTPVIALSAINLRTHPNSDGFARKQPPRIGIFHLGGLPAAPPALNQSRYQKDEHTNGSENQRP